MYLKLFQTNNMKKLLLFISAIVVVASLNSCSSDSGSGQSLSFKVNGVQKSFRVVAEYANSKTYIYGYIGNSVNPTEVVEFNMQVGVTTNPVEDFSYHNNESNDNGTATVLSNVISNTSNKAEGTFSGTIIPSGGGEAITISDGKFSVKPKFAG